MTRKKKRLAVIGGAMAFLAMASGLTLYALGQRTSYFFMPADLGTVSLDAGQRIRLGGLVAAGSVIRGEGTRVAFSVTDQIETVNVVYDGILPDLFREEQGIVTEGAFDAAGIFVADSVLAKHDETYMPKDVADRLKESGVWKEDE